MKYKIATVLLDTVAYFFELCLNFRIGADSLGRIGEIVVEHSSARWQVRAAFAGVVAYGNDVVKTDVAKRIDVVGRMVRNVDPVVKHRRDRTRIHAVGFDPCAVYNRFALCKMTQISLGHLASAAVTGTQYQYFFHTSSHIRLMMQNFGSQPKRH